MSCYYFQLGTGHNSTFMLHAYYEKPVTHSKFNGVFWFAYFFIKLEENDMNVCHWFLPYE